MSPVPALSPQALRDLLHRQQMSLLLPAMNHVSGRPPKRLSADEIAMIIDLNGEITALDRKLGRKRS